MADRFCEHLQDYGTLFSSAESFYLVCNDLVEQVLAGGSDPEQVEDLAEAVENWVGSDRELRQTLVDLALEGRGKVPKKKPNATKRHGTVRCSECGFVIPKLTYSDWTVAGTGLVQFHGQELPTKELAGV